MTGKQIIWSGKKISIVTTSKRFLVFGPVQNKCLSRSPKFRTKCLWDSHISHINICHIQFILKHTHKDMPAILNYALLSSLAVSFCTIKVYHEIFGFIDI